MRGFLTESKLSPQISTWMESEALYEQFQVPIFKIHAGIQKCHFGHLSGWPYDISAIPQKALI